MRALLAVLALAACSSEVSIGERAGGREELHAVEVFPRVLDLGERDKGATASATVKVKNPGDVDLVVRKLVLDGSAAWALDHPRLPHTVRPGGALDVRVTFAPEAPYKRTASLTVKTDAPDGRVAVDLLGRGTPPIAELQALELGEHAIGCGETTGQLVVSNAGGHDLKLYEGRVAGEPQLSIGAVSWPLTVVPDGEVALPVVYTPTAAGAAIGLVELRSNDLPEEWVGAEVVASGRWAAPYVVEDFEVRSRAVDILLAVDRSASMNDNNAEIHEAFIGLIDALPLLSPEFQLGVVTGISACFNDTLFTPDTEDLAPRIIDAMQGPGSPLTEALLGLARDAIVATESCNAGFLRPGHPLQLVVVSDEPEQSSDGWEPLVEEIRTWLADPDDLHVSGVVDAEARCGDGASGYLEAAEATDGVIADLCTDDLPETVLDLLVPVQTGVDLFPLAEVPAQGTLSVFVDGLRTDAWTWDAGRSAVRLDDAPEPGSTVRIEYRGGGC